MVSRRQLDVGGVLVGGGAPVSVQSMTTTRTWDVDATIEQIEQLADAGCDIIRIACPTNKDADALKAVVAGSPIPVITDIHFQAQYVFKSIEAGAAAVRINPGNIRKLGDKLPEIVAAAKLNSTPLRIGVNAGSLDQEILEKYQMKATPEALVESALKEAAEFEKLGFYDFAISVKHHDPQTTINAYQLLSQAIDAPLHLGVTEAGPKFQGSIKSAVTFGVLLNQGIGDTIRVSLSDDPIEEVKVGLEILYSSGLRDRQFEIISCPTCGRKEADVIRLAKIVEDALALRYKDRKTVRKGLKVAVMGCIVNGPGEAREADIGVAGGANKGQIFRKGEVIATVPAQDIASELIRHIDELI
ncbi:4-hydroxy-3-methylbut-2-en-1-yl diphosphate synthase (flavodoxin) 1 [Actinomycetota bacterium]|nr:4-hydroxy-3-methylbut-2-en-1-yl diphosphate synthase (flavodoxin) 1 [Actinomycetota bacterium]